MQYNYDGLISEDELTLIAACEMRSYELIMQLAETRCFTPMPPSKTVEFAANLSALESEILDAYRERDFEGIKVAAHKLAYGDK